MKVIHKYPLVVDGNEVSLSLKRGFRIVHAEYVLVEKAVFVWVEEQLAAKIPQEEVSFVVVRSGEPVNKHFQHVATAVDLLAPEAYHIFHKCEDDLALFHPSISQPDFAIASNA
jgi:hypothetical protein